MDILKEFENLACQNFDSQRRQAWKNGPRTKQQKILDKAFEFIESVPYKVSSRWVFYRLYQAGLYKDKKDSNRWLELTSRARHTSYGKWRPDTLADETREVSEKTGGYSNKDEAFMDLKDRLRYSHNVIIDHFFKQENYVELWFEARAMLGQFEYYTDRIDLVPMAGQPSIPFKWKLAERLTDKARMYEKPVVILYFGDEDLAGHVIEETIRMDVERWCEGDFEIVRCGLSEEQAKQYNIPESIEKKGYQWEALSDEAAEKIIIEALGEYIDLDLIDEARREEHEVNKLSSKYIDEIIKKIEEEER